MDFVDIIELSKNETQISKFPRMPDGAFVDLDQKIYTIQSKDMEYFLYVKFTKIEINGQTDESGSCINKFLSIANGVPGQQDARFVAEICEPIKPLPGFYSDAFSMTLYLQDPKKTGGNGFDFEVSSVLRSEVEGYGRCGGRWRAQSVPQKIATPNFPRVYNPNEKCEYLIQITDASSQNVPGLHLDFKTFK